VRIQFHYGAVYSPSQRRLFVTASVIAQTTMPSGADGRRQKPRPVDRPTLHLDRTPVRLFPQRQMKRSSDLHCRRPTWAQWDARHDKCRPTLLHRRRPCPVNSSRSWQCILPTYLISYFKNPLIRWFKAVAKRIKSLYRISGCEIITEGLLLRHVISPYPLPYLRGGCQGTPALRPQFGPNAQMSLVMRREKDTIR